MSAELETAQQFQSAVEVAMRTGDFEPLVELLAADVEVVMPQHTLHGVDAFTEELDRARPSERFELEFDNSGWQDLGDGRYYCEIQVHYRSKVSEADSYSRDRSFELKIGDGKVSRCEMRFAG